RSAAMVRAPARPARAEPRRRHDDRGARAGDPVRRHRARARDGARAVKVLGLDLGEMRLHKPRTPRRYFAELPGSEKLLPLVVLFGRNAAAEMDRAAFQVLVPDIRDAFHLSDQGILTLIALTLLGGLLLQVPLAFYSDRVHRVSLAIIGAFVW